MKGPLALIAAFAFASPAMAGSPDHTPIAEIIRGTTVTVSGTVERILDEDEFRLTDSSGSIRVYVGPNLVPANVGDTVVVEGIVDDDWRKEIYARQMTLADGSVVTFAHRYE